jgi:hypothetical protein
MEAASSDANPHRPGLSPRDQRLATEPLIRLNLVEDETGDIFAGYRAAVEIGQVSQSLHRASTGLVVQDRGADQHPIKVALMMASWRFLSA